MPSTVFSAATLGIDAYPVHVEVDTDRTLPTFTVVDLPIALGVLVASGQIKPVRLGEFVLLGELSLNDSVRPVHGMLSMAASLHQHGLYGMANAEYP